MIKPDKKDTVPSYSDMNGDVVEKADTTVEEKEIQLSARQILFYKGKQKISYYEKLMKERPLSLKEKNDLDGIKQTLFEIIYKFGIQQSASILKSYATTPEIMAEIKQALAEVFFDKLENYNPLMTAPTTYFKSSFQQVVSAHVRDTFRHIKQYDFHNSMKIKWAISEFEEKGIEYNYSMLTEKTGLSAKVIKTTLSIMNSASYKNIDDELTLKSTMAGPEETYEHKELHQLLETAMSDSLQIVDRAIFLDRLNIEGLGNGKYIPYEDLAKKYNMSVIDVKTSFNQTKAILANHPALQGLGYNRKKTINRYIPRSIEFDSSAQDVLDSIELDTD